jgi:hypothetical protein
LNVKAEDVVKVLRGLYVEGKKAEEERKDKGRGKGKVSQKEMAEIKSESDDDMDGGDDATDDEHSKE